MRQRVIDLPAPLRFLARALDVDGDGAVTARDLAAFARDGAALDVTTPEPLPETHELYALENCFVLPHVGSATRGTRKAMAQLACANLVAGLDGRPMPARVDSIDG